MCGAKNHEVTADALTELGYKYRGNYEDESGHFCDVLDKDDTRYCQIHIYTEAADWHSKLKFRDRWRENTELAREYNFYKLELAKMTSNKSEYAEIKSNWVDTFILKIL